MTDHKKKIIAPVLIVIIVIIYYTGITIVLLNHNVPVPAGIIAILFTIIISIVFITVLIERIKEIKKGDYDDLGKY